MRPAWPNLAAENDGTTRLLDLTKYRRYDDLATAVQRLTCRTPDLRRHTFLAVAFRASGAGAWCRWRAVAM